MRPYILMLFFITFPHVTFAADHNCTMKPVPIDINRIAHHSTVKSYTAKTNRLGLTALLKNGSVVKLAHMGCYDSGGIATEWFESDMLVTDIDKWVKKAAILAKTFFDPYVFKLIEKSLNDNNYSKEITDGHLVITGTSKEIFSYSIVFSSVEHGDMLSISYSFSG